MANVLLFRRGGLAGAVSVEPKRPGPTGRLTLILVAPLTDFSKELDMSGGRRRYSYPNGGERCWTGGRRPGEARVQRDLTD